MSDAEPDRAMGPLQAVCALIAVGAVAIFASRSWGGALWLDELLTLTLVRADSLPKMWAGIISGIDGNPPLYLTLAWLLAHAAPASIPTVAILKAANLMMAGAATLVLCRVSRRMASSVAVWLGAFLFVIFNDNLTYVAFELRTYALYFLLAALAVLLQQRLIERPRRRDIALLGIAYAALTLSHTFGIVYVGCIALAGYLSRPSDGWRHATPIILATVPALAVFVCWLPFLLEQSAVAQPYIWITRPGLPDLLESLFASTVAMWMALLQLYCLAGTAIRSVRQHGSAGLRAFLSDDQWQPHRFVVLVLAGILAFTLTAWTVSLLLFPMFVPRYFTPQLIVSFALHVAFCEWLVRLVRRRRPTAFAHFAAAGVIAPAVLFCVVLLAKDPVRGQVPCADSSGAFFERAFVRGDMPIVAESPHVFLPRATYAPQAAAYRFPLDWDVVLAYPQRARGNATDFHIMERLKRWSASDVIQSTDEIVAKSPQFLAIEQSGRAWFHNLRNTRNVTAERLAEVTSGGGDSCTLWKVTSVTPRP